MSACLSQPQRVVADDLHHLLALTQDAAFVDPVFTRVIQLARQDPYGGEEVDGEQHQREEQADLVLEVILIGELLDFLKDGVPVEQFDHVVVGECVLVLDQLETPQQFEAHDHSDHLVVLDLGEVEVEHDVDEGGHLDELVEGLVLALVEHELLGQNHHHDRDEQEHEQNPGHLQRVVGHHQKLVLLLLGLADLADHLRVHLARNVLFLQQQRDIEVEFLVLTVDPD
eukprot:CAMPEP_0116892928 /NCGR_PEP_ID=MMETSP0467-20121206/3037_1 /TAXON_ID=283647 /ORGANISM="Mesodinium pulex, Strain SPMC105" /LENGTH=226 /DNA_ID=CAMNT_0004562319 /DNA_START=2109 /DNA_END=2790 /DNA_ORIENTATION=+